MVCSRTQNGFLERMQLSKFQRIKHTNSLMLFISSERWTWFASFHSQNEFNHSLNEFNHSTVLKFNQLKWCEYRHFPKQRSIWEWSWMFETFWWLWSYASLNCKMKATNFSDAKIYWYIRTLYRRLNIVGFAK